MVFPVKLVGSLPDVSHAFRTTAKQRGVWLVTTLSTAFFSSASPWNAASGAVFGLLLVLLWNIFRAPARREKEDHDRTEKAANDAHIQEQIIRSSQGMRIGPRLPPR
jgi:hypothetical protein